MAFDLGGSFGIDLGAIAQGGGILGSTTIDPAARALKKGQQAESDFKNAQTLKFDSASFKQKMALADEFGINKLSMLGQGNSSAPSIGSVATGSGSVSPRSGLSADERHIMSNRVKASDAQVKELQARAKIATYQARRLTTTGFSNSVSNDGLTTTYPLAGISKSVTLPNMDKIPAQYNHGEALMSYLDAGIPVQLAVALSGLDFFAPGTWPAPFIEAGRLAKHYIESIPAQKKFRYQR